ncbi:precorrin-6y C5,15-methyltransferase (decarboxylating) subunit CbiE [Kushneria aurantia]
MESEERSTAAWLTLVGIGEDGVAGLGEAARAAVADAEFVFGGTRHLALATALIRGEAMAWPSPLHEGIERLLTLRGRRVCVLASGDPFHYGVGTTLAARIDAGEMRVLPACSSFALACARLGWAQQTTRLVSLHGRAFSALNASLHNGVRLLALTDGAESPPQIARLLAARGMGASRVTVLEALGGDSERLSHFTADELSATEMAFHALNTVAIEVVQGGGDAVGSLCPGRAETLFEHDGQITRRDVRAMTLGRLSPRPGERLWDVGAGAGSIAIEWLLSDERLAAVAIERDAERCARIQRNAERFGVPRLTVVEGEAPQALAGLEAPHAIFIGGGVSDMTLMARCFDALAPGGRLVANAVTLESELALGECQRLLGGELTRLSLEHTAPLGGMTGWTPSRTLTQWCWHKPHDFRGEA